MRNFAFSGGHSIHPSFGNGTLNGSGGAVTLRDVQAIAADRGGDAWQEGADYIVSIGAVTERCASAMDAIEWLREG